jgi:hypothetical protein
MEALSKAIHTGLMTGPSDVEGAAQAESVLNAAGLKAVALANLLVVEKDRKLLPALERELDRTSSPLPWFLWFSFSSESSSKSQRSNHKKVIQKIIGFAEKGISLDNGSFLAWFSLWLTILKRAVQAGKAEEALEDLQETGAAELFRPLREALEAAARGSESYLRRVAPEVRQSARVIFRLLTKEATKQALPSEVPATGRRRRSRKSL